MACGERGEGVSRTALLVTGATGLIGSALVRSAAARGWHVCAAVRDVARARTAFAGLADVEPVAWSFPPGGALPARRAGEALYVVHAASPTSGRYFSEHPAETEAFIRDSTRSLLEYAVREGAAGFVFLSSMEAYGSPATDAPLDETAGFAGDFSAPRSSYARGKRAAETLCAEFAARSGLRAMSVRLAQTFGRGVPPTENRVFAQFLRSARVGEPIRLATAGTSTRMYLETADAVSAIETVLGRGAAGGIYNAANPATYCSLAEMAHFVNDRFGGAGVLLGRDDDPANACYPPPHHLRLDVAKLTALGWRPRFGLAEAYDRMAESLDHAVGKG